jgi:4-aminobutyrate aminotransferase-like enzyme
MARGVLAMAYGSKIRLYPPLSISKSLLEEGFMIIEDVFDNVNRTMVSG